MKNRKGFALFYAMLLVILVSMVGMGILTMTRMNREEASRYRNSQSASQLAGTALKAMEAQLANNPDTCLRMLNTFSNDPSCQWFFGTKVSDATTPQVVSLDGDSKYSARVVGFDQAYSLLVVEAVGYDNGGGRKKVTATYKLDGFGGSAYSGKMLNFGLFLGGALQNCGSPTTIKGNVYLSMNGSGNQQFNSGGTVTITGNFKTGNSSNNLVVNPPMTINGNAFIRCPVMVNGSGTITVNGKIGFKKIIKPLNTQMELYGTGLFDSYDNWNTNKANMHSKPVVVKSSASPAWSSSKFINPLPYRSFSTVAYADTLKITDANEILDSVMLPTDWTVQNVSGGTGPGGSITLGDINNWWTSGTLYQGEWLVLQLTSNVTVNCSGTFTHKVIWLTGNYKITVGGNWYDCSPTSNTFIYITGSGFMEDMGVPAGMSFRGFIYANTSSNITYSFGSGSVFNGAIEHANGVFDCHSNLNLDFSPGSSGEAAVQELCDLGVLSAK